MRKSSQYRAEAKHSLSGHWKGAVLSALIILIVSYAGQVLMLLSRSIGLLFGLSQLINLALTLGLALPLIYGFVVGMRKIRQGSEHYLLTNMMQSLTRNYSRATGSFLLVVAYGLLIMLPLIVVCVALLFLTIGILFHPENWGNWIENNPIKAYGIYSVYMLVLMIPAVVYAYSVALVPYIVEDHPELSVRQSLRESRRLMKGHKWQLFCLDLSFIGWVLLGIVTLGLSNLYLLPYQQMARAIFYEDVLAAQAAKEALSDLPAEDKADAE